jgi:hypothetical protein
MSVKIPILSITECAKYGFAMQSFAGSEKKNAFSFAFHSLIRIFAKTNQ